VVGGLSVALSSGTSGSSGSVVPTSDDLRSELAPSPLTVSVTSVLPGLLPAVV
jgi:hypothetical protein